MYEILPYSHELESRWDRFVMENSMNGTFLQTRKFLNYHPEGRFKDASFFVEKSGIIVAVVPGCNVEGEFVSHQGSTFGGPVISKDFYSGNKILEIVKTIDDYIVQNFKCVKLKPTSQIFATMPTDLLDYALEHAGYCRHTELSCYTPLAKNVDPLENCKREADVGRQLQHLQDIAARAARRKRDKQRAVQQQKHQRNHGVRRRPCQRSQRHVALGVLKVVWVDRNGFCPAEVKDHDHQQTHGVQMSKRVKRQAAFSLCRIVTERTGAQAVTELVERDADQRRNHGLQ